MRRVDVDDDVVVFRNHSKTLYRLSFFHDFYINIAVSGFIKSKFIHSFYHSFAQARKVYDAVRRGGGAPSVNIDDVRRRSRDISRQAQSLIDVGERLKRQYGPLIESIK